MDASEIHRRFNRETKNKWQAYGSHRAHVMSCLLRQGDPPLRNRLCLLGAGNCHDVDLPALRSHFTEVHLVDLDSQALERGIARQGCQPSDNLQLHAPVDVSGIVATLDTWRPDMPPDADEIDALLRGASAHELPLPDADFDVVVSLCLLSQIIESLVVSLGSEHPQFLEAVLRIRKKHLETLLKLTRPGGRAILITDVVSSDTAPALLTLPETQLPNAVADWINEQNFFTGLNPMAITESLAKEAELCQLIARHALIKPWRWNLGQRAFAVYALAMERK